MKKQSEGSQNTSNIIQVHDLQKRYGERTALNKINFAVQKGEIVGFLGPNGAGKSTTMNILSGCLSSSAGQVLINGYDIVQQPERAKRNIGYLPEQPPVYPGMTVHEYLSYICKLKKIPRGSRTAEILSVCAQCQIEEHTHRLIGQLSKGYRQRVGIAQALIGAPPLLILDEPTSGLDPAQIIEIRKLIKSLAGKQTVLLSTHILSEIQAICNRIIIINNGQIIADDTEQNLTRSSSSGYHLRVDAKPETVLEALFPLKSDASIDILPSVEPNTTELWVQTKGTDLRRTIFSLLSEKQLPILKLTDGSVTLEQVFMQLLEQNSAPVGNCAPNHHSNHKEDIQ